MAKNNAKLLMLWWPPSFSPLTNLNNFDDQYKRDWKSGHGQQESSKGYKVGADVGTLFAWLLCLIMVNIIDAIIIMVFIRALFRGAFKNYLADFVR